MSLTWGIFTSSASLFPLIKAHFCLRFSIREESSIENSLSTINNWLVNQIEIANNDVKLPTLLPFISEFSCPINLVELHIVPHFILIRLEPSLSKSLNDYNHWTLASLLK